MASLILPSRWRSQPQYPVEVSNEWANDLKNVFTPSGIVLAYGANSTKKPYSNGVGFTSSSAGAGVQVSTSRIIAGLDNSTAFAAYSRDGATTATGSGRAFYCERSESTQIFKFGIKNFSPVTEVSFTFRNSSSQLINSATSATINASLALNTAALVTKGSASRTIYADGVGNENTTNYANSFTAANDCRICGDAVDPASFYNGGVFYIALWGRSLSAEEIKELSKNPWQIFRPQKRVLYFDVANGGGVTGTISATWENFTSSITGTTTVVGAISQTLSNFTSSIDGYPVTTGTIAQTLENYTSTISGSPIDSGTISQTLEDYTSNISGSIGSVVSGTIAVTLENFTQSAQGTTTVIGNMAVNLNDFTSAITGTTTVIGTSNISLDPFIMTANGYPGDVVLIRIRTLVGAGE